jgi:hypothetical protein
VQMHHKQADDMRRANRSTYSPHFQRTHIRTRTHTYTHTHTPLSLSRSLSRSLALSRSLSLSLALSRSLSLSLALSQRCSFSLALSRSLSLSLTLAHSCSLSLSLAFSRSLSLLCSSSHAHARKHADVRRLMCTWTTCCASQRSARTSPRAGGSRHQHRTGTGTFIGTGSGTFIGPGTGPPLSQPLVTQLLSPNVESVAVGAAHWQP